MMYTKLFFAVLLPILTVNGLPAKRNGEWKLRLCFVLEQVLMAYSTLFQMTVRTVLLQLRVV